MDDQFAYNAKSRGQIVRMVMKAKEPATSVMKKERLILASESHFEVLNCDSSDSIRSYSWFTLSKIKYTGDLLFLNFGKHKLSFISTDMPKIYAVIVDILPRILTQTELKSIGMMELPGQFPKPTGISALTRLEERAKATGTRLLPGVVSYMRRVLTFSEAHLRLSEVIDPATSITIILDMLPLCTSVKSISIPHIQRVDSYTKVSNFVAEGSAIEFIHVDGPITRNYDRFLRNIEANKSIPIKGLSFGGKDSKLTPQNLELLSVTAKSRNFSSLGFYNAFAGQKTLDFFVKGFLPRIGMQLTILTLDTIPALELQPILEKTPNLLYLSVTNCQLEITSLLVSLAGSDLKKLRGANFSNNFCEKSGPRSLKLPPMMETLAANGVKWSAHTLPEFLQTVTHSIKTGLMLSVGDADATTDEWVRVFNYLRQTKFTGLHSLVWANNPVHSRLFDFLRRNGQIVHVDLSGCFSEGEPELADAFCNYVSKASNLRSLIVKGTGGAYLGKCLPRLLSAVEAAKGIEFLDVSGSHAGTAGIDSLRALINGRSSLKALVFAGIEPEEPRPLFDLLDDATHSLTKAAVSFPSADVDKLLRSGLASQNAVDEIRSKLMYSFSNTDSPFDDPFYIYREEDIPPFPVYLSEKDNSNNGACEKDKNQSSIEPEMYTLDGIEPDPEPAPMSLRRPKPAPIDTRVERPTLVRRAAPKEDSIHLGMLDIDEDEEPKTALPKKKAKKRRVKKAAPNTLDGNEPIRSAVSNSSSSRSSKLITENSYIQPPKPPKNSEEPQISKPSENPKPVDTSKAAEAPAKETKKRRLKKRRARKDDAAEPSTLMSMVVDEEGEDPELNTLHTLDGEPPETEPSTTMDESSSGPRRRRKKHHSTEQTYDWSFPIQFDLFGRSDHEWRRTERRYSIDVLHATIHNTKPEKKPNV